MIGLSIFLYPQYQGAQRWVFLVVIFFFVVLKLFFLLCCCYICDLVHDVEALIHLPSRKLQFHGHHSYFRKDFQMLFAANIGLHRGLGHRIATTNKTKNHLKINILTTKTILRLTA